MVLIVISLDPSKLFCNIIRCSPVKLFLSSRQAGYSNRQQRQPCPEYKSDKCEVSGRYFVVGGQMAGCWHFLTWL